MASTEGLVPITRAFLSKFYDNFPFVPLSPDVSSISAELQEQYELMSKQYAEESGNDQVASNLSFDSPHKIDQNFWKNREQIEEITFLLDKSHWPATVSNILENEITLLAPFSFVSHQLQEQEGSTLKLVAGTLGRLALLLRDLLKAVENYQLASSEKVFGMILTYMPQDFRASLIKQQRDRSERRRQAEAESLVNGGGNIHDKYALLWKQQMDRRNQLAMLGSATGVYKTLLRFLVGVPPVLLDFVQQINDHNGPMEEQRQRYGPPLYQLTQLALHIRIFLDLWWKTFDRSITYINDRITLLERSVNLYTAELSRFLKFLGEVFDKSPFLISADEAGSVGGKALANEFKETVIATGKTHEVLLNVDTEGSFVVWDFKLTSGKDVGFSVEYINANGTKTPMFPYQRYESHQGNFYSPGVGSYRLIWDNSYSTFYRKTLRYRVDAIPPVTDAQETEGNLEDNNA